jgi:hypothetical protein
MRYTAWSEREYQRLKELVASGASALRASVVLKRSMMSVRNKARDLGTPFPSEIEERAKRRELLYPEQP